MLLQVNVLNYMKNTKKKMFKTVVKINIKKLIIKNVCAFLLMHLITRYSGKTKNYHDFDVIMNV